MILRICLPFSPLVLICFLGCGGGSGSVSAPTQEYIESLGEEDPNAVRPALQPGPAPEIPPPPPAGN